MQHLQRYSTIKKKKKKGEEEEANRKLSQNEGLGNFLKIL